MDTKINSRGQVTIFVILAILIVVIIIAGFYFLGRFNSQKIESTNAPEYIDKCVRDSVEPSVSLVLANGGVINPSLFILYKSQKYNYLCYQKNYYLACVNYFPLLKYTIESEIKKNSEVKVRECFNSLKAELEKKNFAVDEGQMNWSVELVPGKVLIKINRRIAVTKGDNSQSFTKFNSEILSPIYELQNTAHEIANQESQYCNFEYNGFMLLYPEYKITRIDYSDSKLYKVINRQSGKEFKFAVRSCAFPPGL